MSYLRQYIFGDKIQFVRNDIDIINLLCITNTVLYKK